VKQAPSNAFCCHPVKHRLPCRVERNHACRALGVAEHARPLAAVAALGSAWPRRLSDKEVRTEATNAIAYASTYHTAWFWNGMRE